MTLVIAKKINNKIFMMSDRIAADSRSGSYHTIETDKIIKIGKWYVGYSGSFILDDIFRYRMCHSSFDKINLRHTHKKIVPAIRDMMVEEKQTKETSGHLEMDTFPLILVNRKRIHILQEDFSLLTVDYAAIGSGQPMADVLLSETDMSLPKIIKKVSKMNCFVKGRSELYEI